MYHPPAPRRVYETWIWGGIGRRGAVGTDEQHSSLILANAVFPATPEPDVVSFKVAFFSHLFSVYTLSLPSSQLPQNFIRNARALFRTPRRDRQAPTRALSALCPRTDPPSLPRVPPVTGKPAAAAAAPAAAAAALQSASVPKQRFEPRMAAAR